jgi:hypothetical protein
MSAALEHAVSVVPPRTSSEFRRVEELLLRISADVARMDAKVQGIADTQKDLREELRAEVRRLSAEIKAISDQRASDMRTVAAERDADKPAIQWAKWQRGFVFWLAVAVAGTLVTWAVGRLADWEWPAAIVGRFQ